MIRSAYTAYLVLQALGATKKSFQKYLESQGLIAKPASTQTADERAAERAAEIERAHERANRVINLDQKRKQRREAV